MEIIGQAVDVGSDLIGGTRHQGRGRRRVLAERGQVFNRAGDVVGTRRPDGNVGVGQRDFRFVALNVG